VTKSYKSAADMAEDPRLLRRILACAAEDVLSDASLWVERYKWQIVADPAWQTAWQASKSPTRGDDETVITDAMIESRVAWMLQRIDGGA